MQGPRLQHEPFAYTCPGVPLGQGEVPPSPGTGVGVELSGSVSPGPSRGGVTPPPIAAVPLYMLYTKLPSITANN